MTIPHTTNTGTVSFAQSTVFKLETMAIPKQTRWGKGRAGRMLERLFQPHHRNADDEEDASSTKERSHHQVRANYLLKNITIASPLSFHHHID
jgi:hypothetical protein